MNITIRHAIHPTNAQVDDYARVAAEAFKYNYFGSGLGNDKSLQEPFCRAQFAGALVDGAGEVHIAESAIDGVVGIAIWFIPGHRYLESNAQRNAGWNQLMARLSEELQRWWPEAIKQIEGLSERVLGRGVKLGSYHLQLVGVVPAHQGKGVGTSLIQFGEAKARAARVPCVLETSGERNIGYYKSIGYTLGGIGPIIAPPPPSQGTFDMADFAKHTEASGDTAQLFGPSDCANAQYPASTDSSLLPAEKRFPAS